jgi:TP901 family phage tail tape measure protein
MSDPTVSIKFNSDTSSTVSAANALLESLTAIETKAISLAKHLKAVAAAAAKINGRTSSEHTFKTKGQEEFVKADKALRQIQGRTISAVIRLTGIKDVENAKKIIASLKANDVDTAIKLTGIKDVEKARQVIDQIKAKQVSIAARVLGLPDLASAQRRLDELAKKNGKEVRVPVKIEGVASADAQVSTLGSSLASMAKQAVAFTGLSIGAATLVNEVRKAIMAVSSLDSAMSAVAAVGGLAKNSAELATLTEQVRDLGGKTQYGAVGAAEGLKELIAAGYSSADASKLLADTLALAATESMGMGRASEVMVAGLQAFGLSVEEGTRLADVLARAANASTASVDDMGESLKYAAPVANALGISVEETSAALAILANNGIRGGLSGRGLSSVLAKMVAPSKDAAEGLKELGISASDMNPQIVGVEASLKRLASLPQAQLVKMFGVENLDVSNILGRNADGFAKMDEYMRKANVSVKSMSEIRMDNLAGDMQKLNSAVTGLRIELVGENYEVIRDAVQDFTAYLRENKQAIAENFRQIGDLAVVLGQVVAAYAAVKSVGIIGHLIKTVAQWALESKMIDANTAALGRNARARGAGTSGAPTLDDAKGGKEKKGGGKEKKGGGAGSFIVGNIGTMAGAMIGSELAPEDASGLTTGAYSIGGAVIGGAIQKGLEKVGGPIVRGALAKVLTSFRGGAAATAAASAGKSLGTTLMTSFAVRMGLVGASIAMYAAAVKAVTGELDASFDQFNSNNDLGNQMISSSRRMIANAKTEAELAKAKKLILQQIDSVYAQIEDAEKNGGIYSEEQIQNLQLTERALAQIYNNAEKINQRKKDQLAAEQAIKDHNEKVRSIEQERTRLSAEIAENLRQQVEAAKEFNKAYGERRDTAVSGLGESAQLEAKGEDFAKARSDAEQIRKNIEGAVAATNNATPGSKEAITAGLLSNKANAERIAGLTVEERNREVRYIVDDSAGGTAPSRSSFIAPPTPATPATVNAPAAASASVPTAPPETAALPVPQVKVDTAPVFTDLESIAAYYKKVLDEAKKSGNIKLQADVEKYLDDLDKAVKASVEAGAKIKQALEQRDAKVRSLLPTERQEVMADLDFKNSLKAAEDARAQIDAILAEQGMEPLVDPKQEFKNAEDIANYYRRTQNALTKAGKVDLLTKEPFNKLTDAMNKNDSSAKEQDRVKSVQDRSAIQSKEAELAKAMANNDPRRAAQLETELALMKEQQSIAAALNLTGKDGQAEARKLAAGKVSDDLKVRLNEQMAEMNPLQNKPKQLGSGATAMNQLFGRKSNDGLIEQAREQTKYLKELVKLAGIKESIKFVATLA